MIIGILTKPIAEFIKKKVKDKLFPKYTQSELIRRRIMFHERSESYVDVGDCMAAKNERRKEAQMQLKLLRMNYDEDIGLMKERCKDARAETQKKIVEVESEAQVD